MLSKSKKEIFSHCLSSHFVKIFVDPGNLVLLRFYVADHFLNCKKKIFTSVAFEVRFITALPCDGVWFMHD